ncbi:hypothetical protein [Pseudotabrizicola alkalilacus]|uniref:hypothetical protein n=1 Tax=Pseudotabrizicola alkalilacus TaxID=2305252 RepID=UPI0011C10BDC|nr:hypothetical protein [Pseudotabrizicola alkalilacus]
MNVEKGSEFVRALAYQLWLASWNDRNPEATPEARSDAWEADKVDFNRNVYRACRALERKGVVTPV